jgi:cytohesin
LHLAAEFGHGRAASWLLELGADVNIENDSGETPLHKAADYNHVATAKVLLNRGADGSRQGPAQGQPIHAAHSLDMVRLLVELGGADVNVVDGCGDWPLKSAAEDNDVERITWLLSHGAEVDLTSTGETALHSAVRSDSREAVDALLEAGANPNSQDVDGWTPLFGASSREVIYALRKAGADPRITAEGDWGPEKWLKDSILVRALGEQL